MLFRKEKKSLVDDLIEEKREGEEFKPFRATYKIITFTMVVGMLYPTAKTDCCRFVGIGLLFLSVIPLSFMVLMDIWQSWWEGDIINIIRHGTVIGPFFGVLLKMLLFYVRRVEAARIIAEIDADYARYNTLPEAHKCIARRAITDTVHYSERCWAFTVVTCVATFPLTAVVLNFYNMAFESDPTKYMVHDTRRPFSEDEARFDSPYFEIMFVYMTYCSLIYIVSFIGFDAFFGITINHVCLKMELFCKELEDAMGERDMRELSRKMVGVIGEQNAVFRMVDLLQETFNIWLGIIFLATMIQICNCMYQIIEGYGIDPRYLVFIAGTVVHIYLPCRYAAKLQASALEVSNRVYCCGWERVLDNRVRRTIVFMIARAQVPMNITAFNMLNFDMELFVSILQTSYSMFTLLRP